MDFFWSRGPLLSPKRSHLSVFVQPRTPQPPQMGLRYPSAELGYHKRSLRYPNAPQMARNSPKPASKMGLKSSPHPQNGPEIPPFPHPPPRADPGSPKQRLRRRKTVLGCPEMGPNCPKTGREEPSPHPPTHAAGGRWEPVAEGPGKRPPPSDTRSSVPISQRERTSGSLADDVTARMRRVATLQSMRGNARDRVATPLPIGACAD